jgi:glycosyltransferase involved in cell wall biosynthesis
VPLSEITPVLLTFNEEENVGRALESLKEFSRVVVVDSGSTDETEAIARSFESVSWFVRKWTGFGDQWAFALSNTAITTPFVLALDADMSVTKELRRELEESFGGSEVDGGVISFEYRIRGVPLLGSLYPPQLRLLRLEKASAGKRGHAHVLEVGGGRVVRLRGKLLHDDRKSLEAFVRAQVGYSSEECGRLAATHPDSFRTVVRRHVPFAPFAVWLLAYVRAGGPFGGPAARRYALERLIYESMLRWRVEDELLSRYFENDERLGLVRNQRISKEMGEGEKHD